MTGRRLVDGRIVEVQTQRISWRRVVLFLFLGSLLVATNPAHETNTAKILESLNIKTLVDKWTGLRFVADGNSYWKRKTTNYGVLSVKERLSGLEVGLASRSFHVCSWDDPDWGLVCRRLKTLVSYPGVKWWRLPFDQPPVVFHRLSMIFMTLGCIATACHIPIHADALTSMFVPDPIHQNPVFWLAQVFVDSNVLLFPVWERLYTVTMQQATDSPCRLMGSNDGLNFYAAILILVFTAAGVRWVTGSERKYGWLIWVITVVGYWRGIQNQQAQSSVVTETDPEDSEMMIWVGTRLVWFVMINGLSHVGSEFMTMMLALFAGAAWGDYHYTQQVWQVWTSSWSRMLDDAWNQLFGETPDYRAYY